MVCSHALDINKFFQQQIQLHSFVDNVACRGNDFIICKFYIIHATVNNMVDMAIFNDIPNGIMLVADNSSPGRGIAANEHDPGLLKQ